jgi:hypothetical protein
MDRILFQMKLATATTQVALAERELDSIRFAPRELRADPGDLLASALDNMRKAARGLADLGELFNGLPEPSPAVRDCPACRKTIMAAATLCGYCWTKTVAIAG